MNRARHIFGTLWRGIKNLPKKLRTPEPPLRLDLLPEHSVQILVYFADAPVNLYQLRQWYEPFYELNKRHPVAVMVRNQETANILLDEFQLPVMFAPTISDVDIEVSRQNVNVVLYVNQSNKNFQMMRYSSPEHIFINHGESDKKYMVSGQYKRYDYAFIAGHAARERLTREVRGYDVNRFTRMIGRPQIDFLQEQGPYDRADGLTSILYAPTWEGDLGTTKYGSLVTHGVQLVTQLLNNKDYRIIYRPHPRSGVLDADYGLAHQEVIRLLKEANKESGKELHIIDESPEIKWQIYDPDVMITDISAMLYDRLALRKPFLVTKPENETAHLEQGILQHIGLLSPADIEDIHSRIQGLLTDAEEDMNLNRWADYYFGETAERPTDRFIQEVSNIINLKRMGYREDTVSCRIHQHVA